MVQLTNTMSGKKEQFSAQEQKKVTLYVCGITPYSESHLGHARCYISFDVLYRFLTFLGYTVTYCRNFTDIDDKLLNKATVQLGDPMRYPQIAEQYINDYHRVMQALNCKSPTYEPRVTQHIPEIISLIERLIARKHAYVAGSDVYFRVATSPGYPQLSKHSLEDLKVGARVEVNSLKKDPLDFALWKGEAEGTFWQSPWGAGRPGWHIECSALAARYLGEHIDIHAGGHDLIFPHHDNEIAQSEGAFGAPFARFWLHNGFVRIDKEKMSKSLGNFYSIAQLLVDHDPMVIRFYLLNHQYRAPLDFSLEDLEVAKKTYQRLQKAFEPYQTASLTREEAERIPEVQRMIAALNDDLNTVSLFGILFEELPTILVDQKKATAVKSFLAQVLGLTLVALAFKEVVITPEIQALIDAREMARAQKNWARADELREELRKYGVDVQDRKTT